jgi:N-methylhydantoinase B
MTVMIDGRAMDGRNESYIPGDELRISPKLKLHTDAAPDLDPVTYEVIRHNLWNINEEHGETIVRVSGSPIAAFGYDFNPSILSEAGDFVYFGPYLQFHSGMQDLQVKWVLENRSENPGIGPGDMFLSNDPWVGTSHQNDVMLSCPVFWEGELFCWVANTLHFVDLGGPMPGGWNPTARNVFDEPTIYPPIKIVEGGEIRRDIAEQYTRQSRLPQSVALDLRAVIAGNTVAGNRIVALIQRYGAPTVKAVMRRIVDDAADIFTRRLSRIPDGEWSERGYLEMAFPGDRNLYQGELHIRKEGGLLYFSNKGTDPAVGALNVTYAAWRGGILSVVNPFLCPDLLYAIGGPLRSMVFEPVPGTITSASFPSAVSNGGAIGTEFSISMANNCLARMCHTTDELRRFYTANNGITQWTIVSMAGNDQHGQPYQNMILDWYAAPVGAFSFRDGISTGGVYWGPKQTAPNVEHNEQVMPLLYLYRREEHNSGGAGEFVGGSTINIAFTAHNTEVITHQVATCGVTHPTATGIFGGFPGPPAVYKFRTNSQGRSVADVVRSENAVDLLDLEDRDTRRLAPKENDLLQHPGDVYQVSCAGAAGLGDPLDRDPRRVLGDLEVDAYDREVVEGLFGVVVDADGVSFDAEATVALRAKRREERLAIATPPEHTPAPRELAPPELELTPHLDVRRDDKGQPWYCSSRAGVALAPVGKSYKMGCARLDLPLTAAHIHIDDPAVFLDDLMEFRLFLCPVTGGIIETEVARHGDPVVRDIALTALDASRPAGEGDLGGTVVNT